jgi:hypothetical protein
MDKRHFHRVAHDARATVTNGGQPIPATVLDLSLKGCLVEFREGARALSAERDYEIRIHLGEGVEIVMEASLAHNEQSRAGFACRYIDLDSACALRRLVELNLGDPELLERDLEALAYSNR